MTPCLLPLLAVLATAQTVEERHQALFLESRAAEADRRYEDAHSACAEAIALLPEGPRAHTCESRLGWLDDRRDRNGRFRGLDALQAVRADYRTLDPELAVERVTAVANNPEFGELVRTDARIWLARDALDRQHDPAAALAWTEPVVALHHGPLRKSAVGLQARALAQLGRGAEALAVESEIVVDPTGTRRTPAQEILFAQRTTLVTRLSLVVVVAFTLISAPLAYLHGLQGRRPLGLVPLLLLTGGAGLIAERWAEGAGAATPWMALGFLAIHALAGPALRPLTGLKRLALALLAAGATAATTLLALAFTNTLDWVLP